MNAKVLMVLFFAGLAVATVYSQEPCLCNPIVDWICGSDNTWYVNDCEAACNGATVNADQTACGERDSGSAISK